LAFDVHVLGTASARPTSKRQVSGSIIKCDEGTVVIDAGEGFQTRFANQRKNLKLFEKGTTLKTVKIDAVCLTHGHLDHTWGLLPWLQSMSLDNRESPLLVLGPTSEEVFDSLLNNQQIPDQAPPAELARQFRYWQSLGGNHEDLSYPIRWVLGDIENNRWLEFDTQQNSVHQLQGMPQPSKWKNNKLFPLKTNHSVPSCAWMVESKPKPGTFNRMKAAENRLNIEQKGALASGQDIELDDGTKLHASDFRGEPKNGLRVIISGDTAELASGIIDLDNCDLLIHEATFVEDAAKWADDFLHSTATGAARTAVQCGAKHLAITHYSSRTKDSGEPLREAQSILQDSAISCSALSDGDRIIVESDGQIVHLFWNGNGWSR